MHNHTNDYLRARIKELEAALRGAPQERFERARSLVRIEKLERQIEGHTDSGMAKVVADLGERLTRLEVEQEEDARAIEELTNRVVDLEMQYDAGDDRAGRQAAVEALELDELAEDAPAPRPIEKGDVVRVVGKGGPLGLAGKHGIVFHVCRGHDPVEGFQLTADFAEAGGMPLRLDEVAMRVGKIEPGDFGTVMMEHPGGQRLTIGRTRLELLRALDAGARS
jgi:hypothetical protein